MKEEVNYAKLSDFQPVAPTEQPVYANLEDGQPIYAKVGLSLHHRRFIPNAEKKLLVSFKHKETWIWSTKEILNAVLRFK